MASTGENVLPGAPGEAPAGVSHVGGRCYSIRCMFRVPHEVSEGDRVLFPRWAGTEVVINGQEVLILSEDERFSAVSDVMLVRRQVSRFLGYSRFSFRRASSIMNCQSFPRSSALVFSDQTPISVRRESTSPIRRSPRHSVVRHTSSHSATFSQLRVRRVAEVDAADVLVPAVRAQRLRVLAHGVRVQVVTNQSDPFEVA